MLYKRMPIEIESPEEMGYDSIKYNLTESSFRDMPLRDLNIDFNKIVLSYGDHKGNPNLRKVIAQEFGVGPEQVLITVGAAAALFIVASSQLKKGDRILVMRPNYATNIETPRAIEAEIDYIDLKFENNYRPDFNEIKKTIKPGTKLISITNPHNPTGVVFSDAEITEFANIAKANGSLLLVDETYRDLNFGVLPKSAALLGDHVISVSSLSKAYGLPGIRIGWLVHSNTSRMETFLAAKEQIFITGSMVDEEIALGFLQKKAEFSARCKKVVLDHFEILNNWMQNEKRMEWVQPQGGVVAFPRIRNSRVDLDKFYNFLNNKFGTYVGPGHWFEQSRASMRIGYAWPLTEELKQGLESISQALDLVNS